MAMTGVMAVPLAPVAEAPFSALVTIAWPPFAVRLRPVAPLITAPSLTTARVSSTTMLKAIERPRPKELEDAPPLAGSAATLLALLEVALRPAAPVRVTTEALPSEASVWARTRLKASEPATEFFPPPAPEVALAP